MNKVKLKYAPRELFEQILEYAVIPTFDLIVWSNELGVLLVRRKIAPYKHTWALPGLRMMKPENIDDTLSRIAQNEIGIVPNLKSKEFIGQFVGKFNSENQRQDLSTCYAIKYKFSTVKINKEHFSNYCFVKDAEQVPNNIGAMYAYYLKLFFNNTIIR